MRDETVNGEDGPDPVPGDEWLTYADLRLNPVAFGLSVSGRAPVALAPAVGVALAALIRAHGEVVGAGEIDDAIERSGGADPAAVAIRKVRRQLDEAGSAVAVVNRHGRGWLLVDSEAVGEPLEFADLVLDRGVRRLSVAGGPPLTVGTNISAVLALLLRPPVEVVAAAQIEAVAGSTSAAAAIHDLSRRLKQAGSRVRVVNRHGQGWLVVDPAASGSGLSFADLRLDPVARQLVVAGGRPVTVGANVGAVLALLLRHGGGFVTAAQLGAVAGATPAAAAVHDLSRRLERAGSSVRLVNVHGRGWRLVDPATAGEWLSFADLKLDPVTRMLVVTGRDPLTLSAQKSAVLAQLIEAQGGFVTAAQIGRWSGGTTAGVAVHDLGRRLERAGSLVVIVNDHGRGWQLVDSVTAGEWLTFGDLKLDPVTRRLTVDTRDPVSLSASKSAVLEALLRAGGEAVTAAEIIRADATARPTGETSAAVVIAGLRRRLSRAGTTVSIVPTADHAWYLAT